MAVSVFDLFTVPAVDEALLMSAWCELRGTPTDSPDWEAIGEALGSVQRPVCGVCDRCGF